MFVAHPKSKVAYASRPSRCSLLVLEYGKKKGVGKSSSCRLPLVIAPPPANPLMKNPEYRWSTRPKISPAFACRPVQVSLETKIGGASTTPKRLVCVRPLLKK